MPRRGFHTSPARVAAAFAPPPMHPFIEALSPPITPEPEEYPRKYFYPPRFIRWIANDTLDSDQKTSESFDFYYHPLPSTRKIQ